MPSSLAGKPSIAPEPPIEPLPPATEPKMDRFESAIKEIESKPKPPENSTVFIGSSSFARWTSIDSDFKQYNARNEAFGGSTIPEINHYFDRLFEGVKPLQVVMYAGTNDIGDNHHQAKRVFDDFVQFDHQFHAKFPKSEEFYVSISVAPCRFQFRDVYDETNRMIHAYMSTQPHDHFVDVTPLMYDAPNHLNPSLFGPDNLHMTAAGNNRWKEKIKDALDHPNNYK
jgi:lysophospholipase L1-like esterase